MTGYVRQSAAEIIDGEVVFATPLNNEFNAVQTAFNSSTGHTHSGSAGEGPKINLTTSISGALPVLNGGTGSTTASGARTNLGLGTAAVEDVGQSGDAIGKLNTANTWSSSQIFESNMFLAGSLRDTVDDSFFFIGGGNTEGASISLFGPDHATTPDYFRTNAALYELRSLAGSNWMSLGAAGPTFTGTIDASGGSVASPTYSFSSDLDTGMYRIGANTIGFSTAGTLSLTIQDDGDVIGVSNIRGLRIQSGDGDVDSAGIGFTLDGNTGLYRISDNVLGITTGSVKRAEFGSTIGFIGNTSVTGTFSVSSDTTLSGNLVVTGTTTHTGAVSFSSTLSATGSISTDFKFVAPTGGGPSAPTYTFLGDTDTGMYRSSTDQLSFATGGIAALVIGNAQSVLSIGDLIGSTVIRGPAGSAASPTFTFTGDTDTGMYRSNTNEISFSTNGVLAATIQSDGDFITVGNVEAPRTLLGNGTAALPSHSFSSDPNTGMYRSGADTLSFSTGGTLAATISSTGALTTVGGITSGGTVAVTGGVTATTTIAATGNITANGNRVVEVYTGTGAADVTFPVGHIVLADRDSSPDRNASINIYIDGGNTFGYTTDSGTGGAQLTGTWRSRGSVAGDIGLFQRVA